MKKVIILAAIAALTLTACSQNSVIETPAEDAIGFSAFSPVPTKGTVLTGTTLNPYYKEFTIYAYQGTTTFMDDISYVYGSAWDYAHSTDKKYWPSDETKKINFYAYTSSSDNELSASVSSSAQTLDITVPTDNASQEDILVAECLNATKSDRDGDNSASLPTTGGVPMVFKHALSQVNFSARNDSTSIIKVTLRGITVQNVLNEVTSTFAAVSSSPNSNVSNYSAGLNGSAIVLTNSASSVMANDGHLILAPQTTAAWNLTSSNTGARFAIDCKVEDTVSGVVYYDGTVYVPVSVAWVPGYNYTYTFVFGKGAGYDDNGDPVLNVISFVPTVTAWTDATGETVTM
ncbi:MAG: fimbrillin family protein [Bacteroidales bacterium]|jgi:hypothetical protein|nr:fimbrillin family protein [Bacteroidales bacterium]MCI2121996.1 fimbrillin family protein [Bacteroidales bacterium]MCI2145581.1 fimbrillin family protein [Bacteroidales bacterium]